MIKCLDLREGMLEIEVVCNLEEDITCVDAFDADDLAVNNKRSIKEYTLSDVALFRRLYHLKRNLDP